MVRSWSAPPLYLFISRLIARLHPHTLPLFLFSHTEIKAGTYGGPQDGLPPDLRVSNAVYRSVRHTLVQNFLEDLKQTVFHSVSGVLLSPADAEDFHTNLETVEITVSRRVMNGGRLRWVQVHDTFDLNLPVAVSREVGTHMRHLLAVCVPTTAWELQFIRESEDKILDFQKGIEVFTNPPHLTREEGIDD